MELEKEFDATSKKYLERLFENYFHKLRGFPKSPKFESMPWKNYFEYTKNGYHFYGYGVTKNSWGYFECYDIFGIRINEHANVYHDLFGAKNENPIEARNLELSILIGLPNDLIKLFNYNDGIITINRAYEMYSIKDADVFFAAAIKIFENIIEPFFKQIQTVEDVDLFYNKGIYDGDEVYKNYFSDPFNSLKWWKALIASKMSKNPKYQILEDLISTWILYPSIQEEFDILKKYFKENNL